MKLYFMWFTTSVILFIIFNVNYHSGNSKQKQIKHLLLALAVTFEFKRILVNWIYEIVAFTQV